VYGYDFTSAPSASSGGGLVGALGSTLTGLTNTVSSLLSSNPAADRYGHGQHIAGIIAANGQTSSCWNCTRLFKGVAPDANLINLKVLAANGQGSDSAVIQAIDTAIALKSTYNIRVINLRWAGRFTRAISSIRSARPSKPPGRPA
jgi:subtilisin family serine protease